MKIASAPQDRSAGRILAIASGKGGVGKTMLSIGMARAFSQMGERCLLMDGDLGMANIDVQLGLQPNSDISSVINGRVAIADAVCPAMGSAAQKGGFDVISGRSGSGALANLAGPGLTKLATGVAALALSYDRAILDLAAGADRATIRLALTADDVVIVLNDEPTSLTDAYAFVKTLRLHDDGASPLVVINNAPSNNAANEAFSAFRKTCEAFLSFTPTLAGIVRRDPTVPAAIRAQTAVSLRAPQCEAAKDIQALAGSLARGKQAA
ncbi:cobyrinic acid a,c-diamide synthase [Maricaulis sp. W15]|uniref:nucleotide-binding protein n=1 Tax=Maricaulis sp. W15 TaxID=1772333 RepID=UPI000948A747|nr:AAA family ATPase [Maricaulis sp. W15]OLF78207.1 cobyrinic acid a,c-diamide synthase [Maricaulis sp. W15]